MRRLILVSNMTLPDIELGIARFADKLAEKTGKKADYEILFGRAAYPPRVYHRSIVVMLGIETYKTNAGHIGSNAIGILFDSPMTLSCIESGGNGVLQFDFKPKKSGIGIRLRNPDPENPDSLIEELYDCLREAYLDKAPPLVTTNCLNRVPNTLVPNVLGTVKDTTTFAKEFMALNYSVRNELDRDRIRRTLFRWVVSKESIEQLSEKLKEIVGKNTAAIQNLVDTFNPESPKYGVNALNIRKALSAAFGLATAGKNNIPFDKIADTYKTSAYDLRYSTFLFKKDRLLIEDMQSKDVHYNNSKFRSTGAPTPSETIAPETTEPVD